MRAQVHCHKDRREAVIEPEGAMSPISVDNSVENAFQTHPGANRVSALRGMPNLKAYLQRVEVNTESGMERVCVEATSHVATSFE